MVAVPDAQAGEPAPASFAAPDTIPVADLGIGSAPVPGPVRAARAVAVSVDIDELFRPRSDLVRIAEGFPVVEVLVATDPHPAADDDDADDEAVDGSRAAIEQLARSGVRVHRLSLPHPVAADAEPDLVAALSELVGFDPEPGVYCLAPFTDPTDPARGAAGRAAERIAQIYGLPLLRYRGAEPAVPCYS